MTAIANCLTRSIGSGFSQACNKLSTLAAKVTEFFRKVVAYLFPWFVKKPIPNVSASAATVISPVPKPGSSEKPLDLIHTILTYAKKRFLSFPKDVEKLTSDLNKYLTEKKDGAAAPDLSNLVPIADEIKIENKKMPIISCLENWLKDHSLLVVLAEIKKDERRAILLLDQREKSTERFIQYVIDGDMLLARHSTTLDLLFSEDAESQETISFTPYILAKEPDVTSFVEAKEGSTGEEMEVAATPQLPTPPLAAPEREDFPQNAYILSVNYTIEAKEEGLKSIEVTRFRQFLLGTLGENRGKDFVMRMQWSKIQGGWIVQDVKGARYFINDKNPSEVYQSNDETVHHFIGKIVDAIPAELCEVRVAFYNLIKSET